MCSSKGSDIDSGAGSELPFIDQVLAIVIKAAISATSFALDKSADNWIGNELFDLGEGQEESELRVASLSSSFAGQFRRYAAVRKEGSNVISRQGMDVTFAWPSIAR